MLTISYILVSNKVYSVRNERSRTYPLSPDHFPPRMDFNNSWKEASLYTFLFFFGLFYKIFSVAGWAMMQHPFMWRKQYTKLPMEHSTMAATVKAMNPRVGPKIYTGKGYRLPHWKHNGSPKGWGKKSNENQWPEPSHGRQKGRPMKSQKTRSPQEPKKGES
jgi:hypothetical protein